MITEDNLKNLPACPGVYLMKDASKRVIYIGKAKDLRARVRSYFKGHGDGRYAVRFLSSKAEAIDYIVTSNEKEALLLEDTLLKSHKPKYNIMLKDSKTYVSLKLTLKEEFPRILVVRQRKKDGSRYFGPYPSARAVRDVVKFMRRVFPLCVCSPAVFRNRTRPCLDYQMGLCPAPAVGLISKGDYAALVDGAVMFLEGRNLELIKTLKQRMNEASSGLEYEKAAKIRDQISGIEAMLERQLAVGSRQEDSDVFALKRDEGRIAVEALFIREGRLTGNGEYFFEDSLNLPDDEIMSCFIAEFYRGERYIPEEIIIKVKIEDAETLCEWLTEKKGRRVSITTPARGEKAWLVSMAMTNAGEALKKQAERAVEKHSVLESLKKRLHLKNTPMTIDAFDISNLQGSLAVGAMVRFVNNAPSKGAYRLFKIRLADGPDDYAMMREVMARRFLGAKDAGKTPGLPDLILVDGGKGQLNIALSVLDELDIKGVDAIALAKESPERGGFGKALKKGGKGERVYLLNVKDPVFLREGSGPDLLLRRIRDEAHRFAISYHRKLRTRRNASVLDSVSGLGLKRKKALLERFGGIEGILNASADDLMSVSGITHAVANKIKGLKATT